MRTIAHVTHEAVEKFGGIGTVLEGLLTSAPYRDVDQRTILIGPFFATAGRPRDCLGPEGEVLYSSADGFTDHPVASTLGHVRRDFHVDIVYGHRSFIDPHSGARATPEVLLLDVSRMDLNRINECKRRLWDTFGVNIQRHEHSWEFDLYVKLASPAIAALRALGAVDGAPCVVMAHEWMGMPTALMAMAEDPNSFRTVFYAHEVTAMRRIVEAHEGHDITFYNALSAALANDRYLDDVFGSQDDYGRHELVKKSCRCHRIFAVGDYVAKELRFIGPEFADAQIDVTYNGIPAEQITLERKMQSKALLQDYAEVLLGDRPDFVFTHVTRMVTSKGLWRDLRVLEQLERRFRGTGQTAVMFVLSTELPTRPREDIRHMERKWGWPLAHREGGSDLAFSEALFYQGVQVFNTRARQIKIIYVNQFGWSAPACGDRMPGTMELLDLRRGTDVEFGQSVYEPFGISHLEPLTFGGICVVSSVSGCVGLVDEVVGAQECPNVVVADYGAIAGPIQDEAWLLSLSRDERSRHEEKVAEKVADELAGRLPRSPEQTAEMLDRGWQLAREMSWDVIASRHIMPAVEQLCKTYPRIQVA